MIIETKYNLDDLVYFLHNDKITHAKIWFMKYDTINGINYMVEINGSRKNELHLKEKSLYSTKEALLQSL